MVDLLEEVQEDFQNEKTLNFIKQYGKKIIFLMVIVIIVLSVKIWWQEYQTNKIYKEGGQFITAVMKLRANKIDDAMSELAALAKNGQTIYSTLAQLNFASYQQLKRDYKLAEENYSLLLNKTNNNKFLGDYVNLMFIKSQLSNSGHDRTKLLEKLKNIGTLNNALYASVKELQAALQIELNTPQDAFATISEINSHNGTPHSIKTRLSQLQELIS